MEYIVTRKDYNHVRATVEGYYPVEGTFEAFFKELTEYINRPNFVKKVTYSNHKIIIEKLDKLYAFLYTDEYVLDGLLESDARFIELMNTFLSKYEAKKEELSASVDKYIEKRHIKDEALRTAARIYKEYCNTGNTPSIEKEELIPHVINAFEAANGLIYTDVSYTMEGDLITKPSVSHHTKVINRLKVATGVSGVATASLVATSIFLESPILIIAGLATGIGCYCTNSKRKEKNEEEAKHKIAELAKIYRELYPDVAANKDGEHKLTK